MDTSISYCEGMEDVFGQKPAQRRYVAIMELAGYE